LRRRWWLHECVLWLYTLYRWQQQRCYCHWRPRHCQSHRQLQSHWLLSEATNGRALTGQTPATPAGSNSIESCEIACQSFTYFGTEYSNECKFSLFILLNGRGIGAKRKPGYCGNVINSGSVAQSSFDPNTNGCSMLCGGNTMEYVRILLAHFVSPHVLS